jgi:FAD/FMN-containing dehydrogenase
VYRPEKPGQIGEVLASGGQRDYISRGLGRSYGDPAVNEGAGVILHQKLDRMLAFDPQTGVLEAEAGLSLARILDTFVPRGFFPPVTPGTKFVTLGGAIAADVHGKNHHREGSIATAILDFELLTASGQVLPCSREQNADLFWATIGGMGLTGVILTTHLRLMPITSAYITEDTVKARDLDHALELFAQSDRDYQYSVAWVDCLSGGKGKLGRSVLLRGNHTPAADLPARWRDAPLTLRPRRQSRVPFFFPGFVLGPWSVRAFNEVFYRKHHNGRSFIDYDRYFYPLDAVLEWNKIYGRRGFLQYQAVLPPATSRKGLIALLERLAAAKAASFLAVLKSMGAGSGGLLSFPMPGHTLTLDIPYTGPALLDLVRDLDRIVLENQGRLYLAKDACLTPATFRAMYPTMDKFLEVKGKVDPKTLFASTQSRRLGLTGGEALGPLFGPVHS